MTIEDLENKEWWGVSTEYGVWKCPECNVISKVEDWEECRPGCEDCGEHDGRKCPNCNAVFDHVYGTRDLMESNATLNMLP